MPLPRNAETFCPVNPVLFNTGHPEDTGHGMEAHYHKCPECFAIWRHLRPVLPTGEGWGVERALLLMAKQEAETGRSKYREVDHYCPKCHKGPVWNWARGPINPELTDGHFFPMACS